MDFNKLKIGDTVIVNSSYKVVSGGVFNVGDIRVIEGIYKNGNKENDGGAELDKNGRRISVHCTYLDKVNPCIFKVGDKVEFINEIVTINAILPPVMTSEICEWYYPWVSIKNGQIYNVDWFKKVEDNMDELEKHKENVQDIVNKGYAGNLTHAVKYLLDQQPVKTSCCTMTYAFVNTSTKDDTLPLFQVNDYVEYIANTSCWLTKGVVYQVKAVPSTYGKDSEISVITDTGVLQTFCRVCFKKYKPKFKIDDYVEYIGENDLPCKLVKGQTYRITAISGTVIKVMDNVWAIYANNFKLGKAPEFKVGDIVKEIKTGTYMRVEQVEEKEYKYICRVNDNERLYFATRHLEKVG